MKKLLALILSLTLLFAVSCPVSASADQVPFSTMVMDSADLLTDEQEDELSAKAWNLTLDYDCAVYIVTFESLDGWEPYALNEELHRVYGLGYGEEQSCIILLLAMEEREYDIMAHGYGNYAFTDYGKDVMADRFLDEFGDDEWYEGFAEYVDCCEEYLELAAKGEPYDVDSDKSPVLGVVIAAAVSSLIAFIVCSIFKGQMQTANIKTDADSYIKGQGMHLTDRRDVFTHITRSYRTISEKSSSGGTTINSNGSSHKSGKF